MVGGFAISDYLFSKLEDHFKLRGIDILRPDAYLWAKKPCDSHPLTYGSCIRNKAVAEGAIIFKVDPFVSGRVSKYAYGIECSNVFNPHRADHLARQHTCYEVPSGETWVPNYFSAILRKVDLTFICHSTSNIFNRISKLKRKQSSDHLILLCLISPHSAPCRPSLLISNATEIVKTMLLRGSM